MTEWKYILYLADLYDECDGRNPSDIDYIKYCNIIYKRLLLLKDVIIETEDVDDADYMIGGCSGLDSCIDNFKYFDDGDEDHYKWCMTELYDWADWNFVWIESIMTNSDGIGKGVR